VGATIIMAALERRRLADYGFSMRRAAFRFASGLAWGFVSLSLLIALLVVTGHESIDGIAMGGPAALEYAVIWAVVFLLVGISEETIFRGYLQATVTRGMGFWPAAILLSFLFGLIHKGNGEEAAIGLIGAGSAGLLFTYALWRSGSLWWPIGFHTSWDWAQSFFYGTPDSGTRSAGHFLMSHPTGSILWSGGSVGPEGSLFVFLALAFAALIVRLTVKRDPDETPTFSSAGVDVGPQGQDVGR
jgi:membrane protease YdiL (CAAX protease family)